jgi:DNA-binding CsgD family transcriptional regulator
VLVTAPLLSVDDAPDGHVGFVPVRLNPRELRTLELLAAGLETEHIASDLGYSLRTIKGTVATLLTKFNAHTRAQLIHEAHRHGWLAVGVSAVAVYHTRMLVAERRCAELLQQNREQHGKIERAKAALR